MEKWITAYPSDENYAKALAAVNNHVGSLGHEIDGTEDFWLKDSFEQWWEIEKILYEKIFARMNKTNEQGITHYDLEKSGFHYRVQPFMEQNGFRDGGGWWIPKTESK